MNIRETNKGNVKMVMTEEEFKALHALVDFPTIVDWNTIALENHIDRGTVADVWNEVRDFATYGLL